LKGENEREGKKESIIPTQIPRERDMESEIDRHTRHKYIHHQLVSPGER